SKDPKLKFQPPKEIYQSYIDYFEESNEWVRKEFFPHKERLFPKKDMSTYKENYELREMKPEYWDKIAEFIADIIKIKNENILSLNQALEIKNQELSNQANQIYNLNKTLENKENLLNFQNNYGKAKARIQNQLSYKLGQALIINSKSVLGYLSLPFIILSIVISHKQEQKAYKFKIKKNPNLALPPLETYPDYNEAL
ncbi:alpha-2,3-sialyltransferase, partial [Campylobacter jejuni]